MITHNIARVNQFAVATYGLQMFIYENSTFRGDVPPLNYNEFE